MAKLNCSGTQKSGSVANPLQ